MALTSKALASLDANYNPQGAMGGLFAPAYVPGYAPAEKAVMGWQSGRGLSGTELQQTAMPGAWQAPVDTNPWSTGGVGFSRYGPNLADNSYSFGGKSSIDPAALRAAAQNTPYDLPGRREQIAQQLASNEMAQAAYEKKQEEQMAAFMAMQQPQMGAPPVHTEYQTD